MLQEHEQLIKEDILPRLKRVEDAQIDFTKQVESIKASQTSLELTVMKDGKETRELLKPFADHYLNQVTAETESKKDIKLKQLDTREKIIVGVASGVLGTGGLAGIITAIVMLINRGG
ncbi:hypothetical protein [Domibacillus mangrovi]|uniref:Uncharacterized protein n=1 Tax=Domibacillus mangrovi TaxID=1714354 RepID=A0A1Q5P408_9BACI|nr:hypothetical protein [Domibacillus mangrovi]OKL36984.1 hypothetical protein BLL40_05175 [Domibacillus mangrovi]